MKHTIVALLAVLCCLTACVHVERGAPSAAPNVPASLRPASIAQSGTTWTLESNTLHAVVKFENGSIDLTSLFNKRAGREYLTGSGQHSLFRHTVDGQELSAQDGKWTLGAAKIADITAFDRHWGQSLTMDLSRPTSKLTITLVFEIYDGDAGLRYGSFIQNDDATRERVISSSDILTLNVPDKKHTIDYVPWQTIWSSTTNGLEKAKRNCILCYDSGDGLAVLPENNWATSLSPGAAKSDPEQPFLFMNVFSGGDAGVRVFSNPKAVRMTLFPRERFEYFWVNLQCFTGDALDGRAAVAEHFRKSFKYYDALPQMDFQEYRAMYLQNDAAARKYLLPALVETGFDKWEVTWRWNGGNGADSPRPLPGFTTNLPALAEYANRLGLKIGYYFTMTGCPGYGWGGGRDLANPAEIAFKRNQVENILIKDYHSTWQMIDMGELWLNLPSTFTIGDITDLKSFAAKLDRKADPVSTYLMDNFSSGVRETITEYLHTHADDSKAEQFIVEELNRIVRSQSLYSPDRFNGVELRPETKRLLALKPSDDERARLNLLLLEDFYPLELSKHPNDKPAAYSHPSDNVYRKFVLLRNYMSSMARAHPGFQMLTSCETENNRLGSHCVSLMLIGENGEAGTYRRTDGARGFSDVQANLRDSMSFIGMMPLEAAIQVHGEDSRDLLHDMFTPPACYASLLGGCSTYYSDVRRWTPEQRKFLRQFNDWRKSPRIGDLLRQVANPLATGDDNKGPYAWMYTNAPRTAALLLAVGFDGTPTNLAPRLRTLDADKTYLIEEITQTADGRNAYAYRGEYAGRQLIHDGLPLDLVDRPAPCAAFWIQEKNSTNPQVLYAEAAISGYTENTIGSKLAVEISGTPNADARLFVCKPSAHGVESRVIKLDATGRASASFDAGTITDTAHALTLASQTFPATATFVARDITTSGQWRGKYGTTAAWVAGQPVALQNGYTLSLKNGITFVWGKDDQDTRVLQLPSGVAGSKLAACWTAVNEFDLQIKAPKNSGPYKLTVYLMDYANIKYPARAMELSIHTCDGKVLDTQRATKAQTNAGIYLTWTVIGPVTVHARKTEGSNAAVSGAFIDEIPAQSDKKEH